MTNIDDLFDSAKMKAASQLIERTGAKNFRIGMSDDGEEPTVWYVCAAYKNVSGVVAGEAAAAMDPLTAMLRLCEQLINGAECTNCGKTTGFSMERDDLVEKLESCGVCIVVYNEETESFNRSCDYIEGMLRNSK